MGLIRDVEKFNRHVPISTLVYYVNDAGEPHQTRTRSLAWVADAVGKRKFAVIALEGVKGCHPLHRVLPVDEVIRAKVLGALPGIASPPDSEYGKMLPDARAKCATCEYLRDLARMIFGVK